MEETIKPRSEKKKRVVMCEPVIGNQERKASFEVKKKTALTSKQDLPHYFLDTLLQPNTFMNA